MFRNSSTFLVFVAVPLALGLTACGQAQQPDPRTGSPLVRTAVVEEFSHAEKAYTGTVVARVQSELGFRVAGKVVRRLVDAGATVKRGQPLMQIDPADLALAAQAQTGAVMAARALAAQTSADERRYRTLVAKGVVSASAYDQAKAAADSARAQLNAAQAQEDVARHQAGYSVLTADDDGVVMETLAEPGQVVSAGQTVVKLAHAGPREAVVYLPETQRPLLGTTGQARLYGDRPMSGRATLRQLSDTADPQTRTFEARYVLSGAMVTAPLGATVTVALPDPGADGLVSVPLGALYDEGQGPGVWLVAGDKPKAVWRAVRLSGLTEESAILSGGLKPGDRFVTLGAHLLHQDEAVRLADNGGAVK
ncbi:MULTISPECIES: efflux RND transporter periplasmic adaptor subunit [Sodalis]|jgi:RND family efflux transporter MFP subunit|uniref:RND family efflux transporter MFP subunit n=1 Tax=Sodalis ligni TaxID=2697027 RepID=A0A4R1NJD8_9GAMM|nr:efflux RND transporter periplasmic adaptor subunit [Sodalis ligni]TCL06041.1 RND family efflux transporter MFP subunit [Sodalis ligni]